jgi:hypothetical protein
VSLVVLLRVSVAAVLVVVLLVLLAEGPFLH